MTAEHNAIRGAKAHWFIFISIPFRFMNYITMFSLRLKVWPFILYDLKALPLYDSHNPLYTYRTVSG